MEQPLTTYAKQLQALAATGLMYSKDHYDIERFQQIANIAQAMLADMFATSIERITELTPDAKSYPTPKVDVRGAVIENNKILMVREGDNGRWTLPGGFAEVGYSPAENVAKEIREEACIDVVVKHLFSVRHKAKGPFDADVRDFYKLYFLCERSSEHAPRAGDDVTMVQFFGLDELPELCTDRVVVEDIQRAFAYHLAPDQPTLFD